MGAGVKNMKLSFSTLACPRWSFEEMLAIAKDLHMNGIEIRGMGDTMYAPDMEIFSSANLPKTLKRLKETGLSIPILTSGAYFASAQQPGDPVGEACAYIDLAERLGVPYVRVMAEPTPQPEDGDLDLAAKKYAQVCAYAKGSGVTPLIETNGHLASSDAMLRFLEAAGKDNAAVLWDIHHTVRYFAEKPEDTVKKLGGLIKHVHVKDSVMKNGVVEYRMMGYGDIPVQDALTALEKKGYDGFISLEWVKRWNPELEEPGIAFACFCSYMNYLLAAHRK